MSSAVAIVAWPLSNAVESRRECGHYRDLFEGCGAGVDRRASYGGGRQRRAAGRGDAAAHIDLGPLSLLLGYALRRAQLAVYQDFFRNFAKIRLRPAEFAVLTVIERNPGLKQTEVATALAIKRTNFVVLAHGLERRGLVERRASARDRRSNALYITDSGKTLARRARQLIEAHERRFSASLGEQDFARLVALLHEIADMGAQ